MRLAQRILKVGDMPEIYGNARFVFITMEKAVDGYIRIEILVQIQLYLYQHIEQEGKSTETALVHLTNEIK